MDIKDFKDYKIANITEDEAVTISELEKQLCDRTKNDIVLIAFQPENKAKV